MFLRKIPIKRIRLDANPYYEEEHQIAKIDKPFMIQPEIKYSSDFTQTILVLNVKASFIDMSDNVEIVGYEGIAKAILLITNRIDDKAELTIWLGHILATLRGKWKAVCPLPYMSNQLILNVHEEGDKILDFLEEKGLYK